MGILLICASATILVFNRIADQAGIYNTLLGFLAPWVLVMIITLVLMPGASYVVTWALLLGLLPVGRGLFARRTSYAISLADALFLGVAALPVILFVVGILTGFYAALMFVLISLYAVLLLFAASVLMPHIRLLTGTIRKAAAFALFLPGVISLLLGVFWPGFSAGQPKFNSITYGLNADTNEALYMSCDEEVDTWTQQFLGANPKRLPITDFIPIATRAYLQAPAPALPLEAPTLEVQSDTTHGDRRTLTLTIDSPRGAEVIEVYALPGTEVLEATVNGVKMETSNTLWRLSYSIYRGNGIQLELVLPANSAARFRVADHHYYLENIMIFEPRPYDCIPKPNTVDFNLDPLKSEESIVVKTFDLAQETTL